jgi:hypothetical protein
MKGLHILKVIEFFKFFRNLLPYSNLMLFVTEKLMSEHAETHR